MTEALDEAFVPKLASKARLTFDRHDQKHVLLYPERGLVLNESGAAIVKLLDGTRKLGRIIDELRTEGVSRSHVADDVIAFVTMLRDKGLLQS